MPIPMSISEKKNSTSLIKENVPPWTSTSKLNQDPDIRLSFPLVDYLKMHELTSSIAINMLTLNHGNLTRNPKLDNREVCNMPMKDRPMMQNSAHMLCLNEADAFFSPNDEKPRELIKTFIRYGYKGIVIKQWSSRPIACFVRGGPSARVELLARHISTKSQNWGTTFGMFLRNRRKLH